MQARRFQLEQRLKNCYNKRASRLGLGLTPACRTLVERMINNGIARMEKQGASEREEQIHFAEQNLHRYLSKLSDTSQSLGTFPVVDDKAFDKVFKEQCPMWPYC
jgi:hypothetical protein